MTVIIGTGGTVSGIGRYLKSMKDDVLVVLCDPEGSGLYNKVCRRACVRSDTTNCRLSGQARRDVRPERS